MAGGWKSKHVVSWFHTETSSLEKLRPLLSNMASTKDAKYAATRRLRLGLLHPAAFANT